MEATIYLSSTHKVSMVRQPRTFFADVFKKYCSVCSLKVHTKSTYKYIQNLKSHRDSQTKKARILHEIELLSQTLVLYLLIRSQMLYPIKLRVHFHVFVILFYTSCRKLRSKFRNFINRSKNLHFTNINFLIFNSIMRISVSIWNYFIIPRQLYV